MNEFTGFVNALNTVDSAAHFSFRDSAEENFFTLHSVPMSALRDGIDYTVQLPAVKYAVGDYNEVATNFDCRVDAKNSFKIKGYVDIGQSGSDESSIY
ncbi:hypothetical protein ACO0R3_002583 [Hanseniaspora guilliermondii]